MHHRAPRFPLLTWTLLALSACSDDEQPHSDLDGGASSDASVAVEGGLDAGRDAIEPGFMAVTLRFRATVGAEEFACGRTFAGQGSSKTDAQPRDFRFFVERVRLVTRGGIEVPLQLALRAPHQTPEVGLIDFTGGDGVCLEGATPSNTILTGKAPVGDYTGVVFSNGVPEALNHGDPALSPPPLTAPGVSWSWLRGYRFFLASVQRVASVNEAVITDAGMAGVAASEPGADGQHAESTPGLGVLHVGSLACAGGIGLGFTCSRPNRNEVRLMGFDPATSTIVADLGAVFADVDLVRGVTCHLGGEDYCGRMFPAVGLDLTTGTALPTQRVFHIE